MIELERIDRVTKMSLLSSHVALPREGHLEAAVHIMTHAGQKYNFRLVYDPSYQECDWSEFYRDAKEAIL